MTEPHSLHTDIWKNIRRIEITTRRLVDQVLSGQYVSVFKGMGLEFEEVRPYQEGDDERHIDWNVTARTGQIHVKRYIEERELSLFLLVDISPSVFFGSQRRLKLDLAIETTEPVFADEPAEAPVSEPVVAAEEEVAPEPAVEEPVAGYAGTVTETAAEPETAADETPAEEPAVDPHASWWVEPEETAGPAEEEVAEDTEAFLEKVFSGIGGEEEPEQRQEEGFGLLRRRRLGVMRDISNDS